MPRALAFHLPLCFYGSQHVPLDDSGILTQDDGFEAVEEPVQHGFVGFLSQDNHGSTAVIQFLGGIFLTVDLLR